MDQPTLFPLPPKTERRIREGYGPDRPTERSNTHGVTTLSDAELVAVIVCGNATPDEIDNATALLTATGGLLGLQRTSVAELSRFPGMTTLKATRLVAALDLVRRVPQEALVRTQIKTPADAAPLFQTAVGAKDQEHLVVVCLDTKNRVMAGGVQVVYIGSVNSTAVRIGEIFRPAVQRNATAIIIAHNHPSGDCTPSPEDVSVTKQIVAAGRLFDIDCLDHLVVSPTSYVSLRERGLGFA